MKTKNVGGAMLDAVLDGDVGQKCRQQRNEETRLTDSLRLGDLMMFTAWLSFDWAFLIQTSASAAKGRLPVAGESHDQPKSVVTKVKRFIKTFSSQPLVCKWASRHRTPSAPTVQKFMMAP